MRRLLPLLLGEHCVACGGRGPALCDGCAAQLRPPPALALPAGVASCRAWCSYEGVARALVGALKYDGRTTLAPLLGTALAELVAPQAWHDPVLTWAPTTPARRRRRGFDQAELLARDAGRTLRSPVRPLLRRLPGPHQTGRAFAERAVGPRFAAVAVSPGATVVVIDDVRTTGATLAAAAAALHAAGAHTVHALVVAATPTHHHAG